MLSAEGHMTAAAPTIRMMAPADYAVPLRGAARAAACAAVDAVAALIMLHRTALPPSLEALAIAIFHGAAVLLVAGLPFARSSRRWLCVAAVLGIPGVGAAVAAVVFATRGRGSAVRGRRAKPHRRPALTMAAVQHLGDALSPCDALDGGDEEQRRGALSTLSRRRDPEAIGLLRRAAAGRDRDLALSAALVLDEIGELAERQEPWLDPAEIRHVS